MLQLRIRVETAARWLARHFEAIEPLRGLDLGPRHQLSKQFVDGDAGADRVDLAIHLKGHDGPLIDRAKVEVPRNAPRSAFYRQGHQVIGRTSPVPRSRRPGNRGVGHARIGKRDQDARG